MDGVYNIQVLLRAAEFLERRERGKRRALTTIVRIGASYCFKQQNRQWEGGDFIHVWNGHWLMYLEQMPEKAPRLFLGGYFGAFPCLTQWPTYRSDHCTRRRQSGPVWKWAAGACASSGNERRPEKPTPLECNHYFHAPRSIVRIRVREGANGAEITAETVCDGAKTKQCPAAIDDSSLLCPPSNPSAQGEKPENLHRSLL